MRFLLKSSACLGARLGILCEMQRLPDVNIETPAIAFYTKGATVPHLTDEVLQMLTKDCHVLFMPLVNVMPMETGLKAQREGVSKFSSTERYPCFLGLNDPTIEIPENQFKSDKVPVWTRCGKVMLDADRYMNFIELYKPDFYTAISDSNTGPESSKKRVTKSVQRTTALLRKCVERHTKCEALNNNSTLIAVLSGGYNKEDRQRCLNTALEFQNEIGGFFLDGLRLAGSKEWTKPFSDMENVAKDITAQLPSEKLRIFCGNWNPVIVLRMVSLGWDLFDSSYATLATDKGFAFTFSLDLDDAKNSFLMDLNDVRYKDDFFPILESCDCVSCTKHTRAYVNHLLVTKELLGPILLTLHNLHHYLEFFKSIRLNISTGTFEKYSEVVTKQYEQYCNSVVENKDKSPDLNEITKKFEKL